MSSVWRAVMRDAQGKVSLLVLGLLAAGALGADLLAAPLPLAVRVDGRTWWLPCLTEPVELRNETLATLHARAQWMIATPVGYGPNQTVATIGGDENGAPPFQPGSRHVLGTDELGRDVLARLIHGARVSLFIAFFTVLVGLLIGLVGGASAGYFGGVVDVLVSRAVEILNTFPTVFFLIALLSVLRTQSLVLLVIVLGLTRRTDVPRLVRAEVMRIKALDFVLVARALGASHLRILLRHVIPNAMGPVLVAATFDVGASVLLETTLSFLGIGVSPPTSSWGELLTEAHRGLLHPGAWWLAVFPGLAIATTVLAVNGFGESLRRAFDGRS